jgi:hypothetical protein
MDKVHLFYQMDQNMKVNGKITKDMAKVCIFGQMENNIKVNGIKAKCMDKDL